MVENIHIIAQEEELLARVAYALQEKGHTVSCSGCPLELQPKLQQGGVFLGTLQEGVAAGRKVSLVVASPSTHSEEMVYVEASHLPVVSMSDLFVTMTENKALVVECNSRFPNRILSIILHMLQSQNRKCDYLTDTCMCGISRRVSLSENTRICLLEGDLMLNTENRNYKSNILILSSLLWKESSAYPTFESYLEVWHKMVNSIDRNGILIYNQTVTVFQEWAENVREDITAIPYKAHACRREDGKCSLVYAKNEIPVPFICDEELLCDINAARLACRQLGITDKVFYQMITSADFLVK